MKKVKCFSFLSLFSHSGCYYGSLTTHVATPELIRHKSRHELCLRTLPRPVGRAAGVQALGSRAGNAALPSFVYCVQQPTRAHLSVPFSSIKEPLRSTRLATGCHCYSTHTIASAPFRQGLDPDSTWAPRHLTFHRIVIPSGGPPPANSTFPVKAASLPHCLSAPIVLHPKRKGGERGARKKRASMVPHITGASGAGLGTFMTSDKTNVL